jgi:Zinc finger, C2H2 type
MNSYIYLIHVGGSDPDVYKIGRTTQEGPNIGGFNRFKQYDRRSTILHIIFVNTDEVVDIERKIIKEFNKHYILVQGREWFRGNLVDMIKRIDMIRYDYLGCDMYLTPKCLKPNIFTHVNSQKGKQTLTATTSTSYHEEVETYSQDDTEDDTIEHQDETEVESCKSVDIIEKHEETEAGSSKDVETITCKLVDTVTVQQSEEEKPIAYKKDDMIEKHEEVETVACKDLDKTDSNPPDIQTDTVSQSITESTSKIFVCEYCRKDFSTKYTLQIHLESACQVIFPEKQKRKCGHCLKEFSKASNCARHMKTCKEKSDD